MCVCVCVRAPDSPMITIPFLKMFTCFVSSSKVQGTSTRTFATIPNRYAIHNGLSYMRRPIIFQLAKRFTFFNSPLANREWMRWNGSHPGSLFSAGAVPCGLRIIRSIYMTFEWETNVPHYQELFIIQ